MHLIQPVGNLLEAFAQSLLQRGVEFFVDRGTNLLELPFVVRLYGHQPLFDGVANLTHALIIGLRQGPQLIAQRFRESLQCQRLLLGSALQGSGLLLCGPAEGKFLGVARSQCLLCQRMGADAQGVGHVLMRSGELGSKAVDLLVLSTSHIALLGQERLLKTGQRLRQFLTSGRGAAGHLVAQLTLQSLRIGTQRGLQEVQRGVVGAPYSKPNRQ